MKPVRSPRRTIVGTALISGGLVVALPAIPPVSTVAQRATHLTADAGPLADASPGDLFNEVSQALQTMFNAATFLGGSQREFISPFALATTVDTAHSDILQGLVGIDTAPPTDPTALIVDFLASPLSGALIGAVGPFVSPVVVALNIVESIADNPANALQELAGAPAALLESPLNGATLDLAPLIPLLASLSPGTDIAGLNLAFGGLFSLGATSVEHVAGGSILNSLGFDINGVPVLPNGGDIPGNPVGPIGGFSSLFQAMGMGNNLVLNNLGLGAAPAAALAGTSDTAPHTLVTVADAGSTAETGSAAEAGNGADLLTGVGSVLELLKLASQVPQDLGALLQNMGVLFNAATFLGGDQQSFLNILANMNTLDFDHNLFYSLLTGQFAYYGAGVPEPIATINELLASPVSAAFMGLTGPLISPAVESLNIIQNLIGDPANALQSLANAPIDLIGSVVNGATLDLNPLIPVLSGLFPEGTTIHSLDLGFGGLLTPGGTLGVLYAPGGSVLNALGIDADVPIFGEQSAVADPVGPIGGLAALFQAMGMGLDIDGV